MRRTGCGGRGPLERTLAACSRPKLKWPVIMPLLGLAVAVIAAIIHGSASAGSESRAATVTLRGRVVDVEAQAPVAGAVVRIKGAGSAVTDARGRFRLALPGSADGPRRMVVRAPGYWRRVTWLADGVRRTTWSVIPRDGALDLDMFGKVARGRATSRWLDRPVFRILEQRLVCEQSSVFRCLRARVSEAPITPQLTALFERLVGLAPALTGGFVDAPVIERVRLQPGATYSPGELAATGAVTLGQLVPLQAFDSFLSDVERGAVIDRFVFLSEDGGANDPRRAFDVFRRAVGYVRSADLDVCFDLLAADALTLHCDSHPFDGPTPLDAAIGRLLYDRLPGNRAPDRDPRP